MVGVKDLHSKRLPTARRPAIDKAGPPLSEPAELLLDRRNQLVFNGVPIRAHVGRIHSVRVVVEGIRVLNFDDQKARKTRRNPLLVKLVGLLLLDAVITGEVETLAVVGLEI